MVMRYTFGPFTLDTGGRRLTRNGVAIALSEPQLGVLCQLVVAKGRVCSKEDMLDAVWRDVAVTPNSLEQAVSGLRRALGTTADGSSVIETVPRQGYRLIGAVDDAGDCDGPSDPEARLAPHRMWLRARGELDTFELANVTTAIAAFHGVVSASPGYAPAHVGLANAYAFMRESTRTDAEPGSDVTARALHHAREACRLAADYGEAWATLAFVLHGAGHGEEARAAALQAITLEPDNWRHLIRMAWVSWGEERLRYSARAIQRLPSLALAHWLTATVHVGRQAFDLAEQALETGITMPGAARDRFQPVGLHWLHGLLLLRRGATAAAEAAFGRELSTAPGHIYGQESCANALCAIGAVCLRRGDAEGASAAWTRALDKLRGHPPALAALAERGNPHQQSKFAAPWAGRIETLRRAQPVDAATAIAIRQSLAGDAPAAAATLAAALASRAIDSQGWTIPVDPLLDVGRHPAAWAETLTAISRRAA